MWQCFSGLTGNRYRGLLLCFPLVYKQTGKHIQGVFSPRPKPVSPRKKNNWDPGLNSLRICTKVMNSQCPAWTTSKLFPLYSLFSLPVQFNVSKQLYKHLHSCYSLSVTKATLSFWGFRQFGTKTHELPQHFSLILIRSHFPYSEPLAELSLWHTIICMFKIYSYSWIVPWWPLVKSLQISVHHHPS